MVHDGHVHTPYCPHGTKDSLASYCENALKLGLSGITFTEHAPLPPSFSDPTPLKDSAMDPNDLANYIKDVKEIKKEYEGALTILLGLEIDFIEGYENETTDFLNEIGSDLDDSILSVHFLRIRDKYICLDYSPDVFAEAVHSLGSIDAVYRLYYKTVLASIQANLGQYKPKRIGHMTLVKKFQKKFQATTENFPEIQTILTTIKENGYALDYNGAGYIKPLCKEPYPSAHIVKKAIDLNIPLVYGSDAHQAKALLSGFDQLVPNAPILKR